MDTSTGEKYTWLYPTNTRRTVTEIKSNVRTSEIKISTVFVTVPLFLFGDACTRMHTLSALEKVEEGSYEHCDLALPSYRWG